MVRLSVGLLLLVLWSVVARAALQEGIDPGAAAASDSKKKPLCFAEVSRDPVQLAQAPPTARQFSRLAGTWEQFSKPSQAQPDPTPFWNLSCPLEWSKYSCVHQGLEAHASAAASWRFVPRDCELPRLLRPGVLAAALGNRSVFIGGDSLARQLFVSLGCRLLHASKVFASPTSVHAEAEWGGPSKRHWSCGSTNNCIQDGPHSGFFSASVSLTTTTSQRANIVSLDLVNLVTNHEKLVSCQDAKGSRSGARAQCVIRKSHPIRVGDIVVLEGGVHGPANKSTPIISKWFRELTAVGAIPVWLPTWPPAFASIDGSGEYVHSNRDCVACACMFAS